MIKCIEKDYVYSDLINMNIIRNKIDKDSALTYDDAILIKIIFKHYAQLIDNVFYKKK